MDNLKLEGKTLEEQRNLKSINTPFQDCRIFLGTYATNFEDKYDSVYRDFSTGHVYVKPHFSG
jgi:hypothetical protein